MVTSLADSGAGSLRSAMVTANQTAATDVIVFSDGTGGELDFQDGVPRVISLASPLVVTEPLEIRGPGKNLLALSGGGDDDFQIEVGETRVLLMTGSTVTNPHRITDLTIRDGTSLLGGANIRVFGSLELSRCEVRDGRAVAAAPNVNFNSTQNADGGGLFHSGGDLLVEECDFVGNGTFGNFSQGGGLYSESGNATIRKSRIYLNTTDGFVSEGGGIGLRSVTVMEDCEVSENETIDESSGGGGIYTDDEFLARNTTISGNIVGAVTGIMGYSVGGAFANVGSDDARFEHCTIVDNEAPSGTGQGGGISSASFGEISFFNTILIGNQAVDLERIPSAFTQFADLGYNFFGTGDGLDLIPTQQTTSVYGITSAVGLLSDLGFHGGTTRTYRLLAAASSGQLTAVDSGPTRVNGELVSQVDLVFDQRGGDFSRVVNGRLDVGAYEFQAFIDGDSDGVPDAVEEIVDGLDGTVADGDGDLDGDGLSNLDEYRFLGIAAISDADARLDFGVEPLPTSGMVSINFNTSPNREYRLRVATDLAAGLQETSADFMEFPEGGSQQLQFILAGAQTFFQLEGRVPAELLD